MHLDKEAQPPQLVVENKDEVLFVNETFGLAGYPLKEGESVMSTPISMGGDFPKTLSLEDTAVVMGIVEQVTESESGEAREALSEPADLKFVSIARLAVYVTLRGDSEAIEQGIDKIKLDSALASAEPKTKPRKG